MQNHVVGLTLTNNQVCRSVVLAVSVVMMNNGMIWQISAICMLSNQDVLQDSTILICPRVSMDHTPHISIAMFC